MGLRLDSRACFLVPKENWLELSFTLTESSKNNFVQDLLSLKS
jgi:hypothetical protein